MEIFGLISLTILALVIIFYFLKRINKKEINNNKNTIDPFVVKAMANKMWDDDVRGKYQNCWYEPLDDDNMIDLSVKFTLSQPVVSFLPPGDPDLFLKGLESAEKFHPINNEEIEFLKAKAKKTNPIGSKTEVFI